MPTYEYACKDCGRHFDIFQGFHEDSLTVCPECQGNLRKKFNSVGVVFKGSGFYRNDSRSSSVGADSAAPAAASAGSGGSDAGASGSASVASSAAKKESSASSASSASAKSTSASKAPAPSA